MTLRRKPFPLIRSKARGSAKEGAGHWWRERVTSVALIPPTLWFFASIIAHSGSDYSAVIAWLRMPSSTLMMVLLLFSLFYHTTFGLQIVIEDYVHSARKHHEIRLLSSGRGGYFFCFKDCRPRLMDRRNRAWNRPQTQRRTVAPVTDPSAQVDRTALGVGVNATLVRNP
jgi:succinate dehydrogenase / fumarate reductase, membrane anchor subunit